MYPWEILYNSCASHEDQLKNAAQSEWGEHMKLKHAAQNEWGKLTHEMRTSFPNKKNV